MSNLEMQVSSGSQAGFAHLADDRAPKHEVTPLDLRGCEVGVAAVPSMAVVDVHHETITSVSRGSRHTSRCGGIYDGGVRVRDVNSSVMTDNTQNGMMAVAKDGGHDTFRRQISDDRMGCHRCRETGQCEWPKC